MSGPVRYAALLRGINVGGNRKVAMSDLLDILRNSGFENCATHLNSGNAVFTTDLPVTKVRQEIERSITENLGLDVSVLLRSHKQLQQAIDGNSLSELAAVNGSRFHLVFLDGPITAAGRKTVESFDFSPDQVEVSKHGIYLWCPDGIGRSPSGKFPWERRLGLMTTMRNWNTVTKLFERTSSEN